MLKSMVCSSQCPFLSTRSVHLCANQGSWAAPSVSLAFEWVDGRIQHDPFHWLNGPLHVMTTTVTAATWSRSGTGYFFLSCHCDGMAWG